MNGTTKVQGGRYQRTLLRAKSLSILNLFKVIKKRISKTREKSIEPNVDNIDISLFVNAAKCMIYDMTRSSN